MRAYTHPAPSCLGQVMGLSHPAIDTREVALFLPFRRSLRVRANQQVPLVTLVNQLMGRNYGMHSEYPVRPPPSPASRSSLTAQCFLRPAH